eukprot:SAG31_NODE_26970_length_433_cov_1.020958_1_plen_143_part_11
MTCCLKDSNTQCSTCDSKLTKFAVTNPTKCFLCHQTVRPSAQPTEDVLAAATDQSLPLLSSKGGTEERKREVEKQTLGLMLMLSDDDLLRSQLGFTIGQYLDNRMEVSEAAMLLQKQFDKQEKTAVGADIERASGGMYAVAGV